MTKRKTVAQKFLIAEVIVLVLLTTVLAIFTANEERLSHFWSDAFTYETVMYPTVSGANKSMTQEEKDAVIKDIISEQHFDKLDDDFDKILKVFDYAAAIPYKKDEFGTDKEFKKYKNPYYTALNNEGDCEGHAALIVTLLRELNVKAYCMPLAPIAFDEDLPSDLKRLTHDVYDADHVVAVAKAGYKWYILDATFGDRTGFMDYEKFIDSDIYHTREHSDIDQKMYFGKYQMSPYWEKLFTTN